MLCSVFKDRFLWHKCSYDTWEFPTIMSFSQMSITLYHELNTYQTFWIERPATKCAGTFVRAAITRAGKCYVNKK